jgi:hypothetical protein
MHRCGMLRAAWMLAATSEVMNVWCFISTAAYVFVAWCLNADRFTFCFLFLCRGLYFLDLTNRRSGCRFSDNIRHTSVVPYSYGTVEMRSTAQQILYINTWKVSWVSAEKVHQIGVPTYFKCIFTVAVCFIDLHVRLSLMLLRSL